MRSKIVIGLAALLFTAPFITSAQSSDVQSQINALLAQIQQLQTLITQLQGTQGTAANCVDLSNNLTLGANGSDVTNLQQYLIRNGVLDSQYATGYYGFLTAKAVGAMQLKLGVLASANDDAFGITGPQTRAAIACNGGASPQATQQASAGAPTCAVRASSNVIAAGASTVITWSSNNATSAYTDSGSVALKGSVTVSPSVTTTYSFSFIGPGGSTRCSQEVIVNAAGTTASGLPTSERDALANAIGYEGSFGLNNDSKEWSDWRSGSSGQRDSVWNALTTRLLANPGDSVNEIYTLFPNLNPNYLTETGVTKSQRDAILHSLGFSGMLNVQDASGVSLFGSNEWQSWLDANGKRAAFNAAIAPFLSTTTSSGAPTCAVSASSNVIALGASTVLTWSSSGATSATDDSGVVATKGSKTVSPSITTTYNYTFSGSGGTAHCSQQIIVNSTGNTVSGLPTTERDALAQAIGYYGTFGVNNDSTEWSTWRSGSSGQRDSVWNTLTSRLLANPGDSVTEIYSLFPNLNPSYMTETGVTKSQRDSVLRSLGYTGMLNVQDASGVSLFGSNEWQSWLDANGKRAAFNAAIAPFLPASAPVINLAQTSAQTTSDGTTGQNFTVSWTVTGAASCTVQHQAPDGALESAWGSGTSGSRVAVANKVGTHHYWIDCTGTGGSAHKDIYHTVVLAAPTVSFTQTSDSTISDGVTGNSFTVSWNATNATSCTVQHEAPDGSIATSWGSGVSGSRVAVANQIGIHTYTIDCTGSGGTTHQSLKHKVLLPDYGMIQASWVV